MHHGCWPPLGGSRTNAARSGILLGDDSDGTDVFFLWFISIMADFYYIWEPSHPPVPGRTRLPWRIARPWRVGHEPAWQRPERQRVIRQLIRFPPGSHEAASPMTRSRAIERSPHPALAVGWTRGTYQVGGRTARPCGHGAWFFPQTTHKLPTGPDDW
jgi:hypothetical protein